MGNTRDAIWTFINAYYRKHKYMPTTLEISEAVGKHVNTVQSHMYHLLEDGYIETELKTTNAEGEKTKTAWATRGYRFGRS